MRIRGYRRERRKGRKYQMPNSKVPNGKRGTEWMARLPSLELGRVVAD